MVGGKVFVWRPACGRQRRLLWADPLVVRSRARIAVQCSRGSPLSCTIRRTTAVNLTRRHRRLQLHHRSSDRRSRRSLVHRCRLRTRTPRHLTTVGVDRLVVVDVAVATSPPGAGLGVGLTSDLPQEPLVLVSPWQTRATTACVSLGLLVCRFTRLFMLLLVDLLFMDLILVDLPSRVDRPVPCTVFMELPVSRLVLRSPPGSRCVGAAVAKAPMIVRQTLTPPTLRYPLFLPTLPSHPRRDRKLRV